MTCIRRMRHLHLLTTCAVALGTTIGTAGCGETMENKTKIEQTSPTGTTTETVTEKVKQTGDNPPPPVGATSEPAPK